MTEAQEEYDALMRGTDRRTGHPEDDDDSDSNSVRTGDHDDDDDSIRDDDEDADGHEDASPLSSRMTANDNIPRARYVANTGPKGVISDAQEFQSSRRSQQIPRTPHDAAPLPSQTATLPLHPLEASAPVDEDEHGLNDDALDDDFMEAWRRQRLFELQQGVQQPQSTRNGAVLEGRYGNMTTVDGVGYLAAVDESPPDTVVIVYIYDDQSAVSSVIEDCLREVAAKRRETRFVRFHFQDAGIELAGVPALIAYRQGDRFASMVPLVDELPDDAELSAAMLENVLMRSVYRFDDIYPDFEDST